MNLPTFKNYTNQGEKIVLNESSNNLHLDHIEDTILDDGIAGAHIALNFIESIAKSLAGHGNKTIDVTTKWDGSPAIVCGINPANGRFFIGTKAVFGKRNPKIIYTKDDIRKYYKDSPGIQNQLEQALEYLPKLNVEGVVQGDMMFSRGEVKEQTIDGENYVTFKPNTIMYAVPFNSDLAEKIRQAKIGIIFHTSYSGNSLQNMTASYKININNFNKSQDVWFDDASYKDVSGTVTFTEDEFEVITQHLNAAEHSLKDLNPIRLEQFLTSKTLIGMIKMYTNNEIRSGRQFHKGFMAGLSKFIEGRIDKEQIRDETKEKKKVQYAALLKRLEPTISDVFQFQYHINEAKLALINKLQQIKSVGTFVPTGDGGYKATKQEGYVAVDHLTNKAIKLVDRLEFSRMNQKLHAEKEKQIRSKKFFENALMINEIFDTTIPVENWRDGPENSQTGSIEINDETYLLTLQPRTYTFSDSKINFINISFSKIVNDQPSEDLTLNNKSASKVIGAITNAFHDKIQQYNYHAVVFVAQDNVKRRMDLYNTIAHSLGQLFSSWKENISLPKNKTMTIMFSRSFPKKHQDEFEKHLQELGK